jgi:AcrR family transcriptional regulator
MPSNVKARQPSRSAGKARQRESTRNAILAAAGTLFVHNGYAATSISAVAKHASVSPESIYVIFGSKRELLRAVMERVAAGPREAVVTDDWLDAVRAEPDQRRRLELMGAATRHVLRRVAPFDEVVRAVATSDPEIADLQREQEAQRKRTVRQLVELLAEAGDLRVPVREAADLMWAVSRSTGMYRSLTVDCRWSDKRAFDALDDVLARMLLPN